MLSSQATLFHLSVFQISSRTGKLQNIMSLRDFVFVNTLGILIATWVILSRSFSHEKSGIFGDGKLYGKLDSPPHPEGEKGVSSPSLGPERP